MILKIKKLTEDAIIPVKAHATDSGFDLFANEDVIVEPGKTVVVKTGIAIELPPGHEAQIRNRSGITRKTNLDVKLGTIDEGYTGDIGIMVRNNHKKKKKKKYSSYKLIDNSYECVFEDDEKYKKNTYIIKKGDKLAQMVIAPVAHPEVMLVDELSETERGEGSYGHTGLTHVELDEIEKEEMF